MTMPRLMDPTYRPGLAYQHAFDWLAVHLGATKGPVACLQTDPFPVTELLRRVPRAALIADGSPVAGEFDTCLDLRAQPRRDLGGATFAAVAWPEPRAARGDQLARLPDALVRGGRLYAVVGGPLARFLHERRVAGARDVMAAVGARQALAGHGFRVVDRIGIHGLRAIAWYQISALAGRIGFAAWQDRLHFAMRRDFLAPSGPAALVCLTAEVA